MNRISEHVAEVKRLSKFKNSFIIGTPEYSWRERLFLEMLKNFKAESKNIITRATDELEFLEIIDKSVLQWCPHRISTKSFTLIQKIKQEIKDWESHLEWLEEQ